MRRIALVGEHKAKERHVAMLVRAEIVGRRSSLMRWHIKVPPQIHVGLWISSRPPWTFLPRGKTIARQSPRGVVPQLITTIGQITINAREICILRFVIV